MENIFFSICIPTYNRAQKLSKAIESVLSQAYKNCELIICDNASSDNTKEVVDSYQDSRIKYFFYKDLVSMYANHNRCLEHSQGEWIVFLHSDDLLGNLENVLKIIDNTPPYTSCCFPISSLDNSLEYNWNYCEILSFLNGFSPSGSLYHRDALKEIGGFKEDNIIADWEILLDLAFMGKKIVHYNTDNISFIKRINDGENGYLKAIKDGTAHQGKAFCVKRQIIKLAKTNQLEPLLEDIAKSWNKSQIMQLNFYLNLNGFVSEANKLAVMAHAKGNYSYWHPRHFYCLLAKYLKLDIFLGLYKRLRLFY